MMSPVAKGISLNASINEKKQARVVVNPVKNKLCPLLAKSSSNLSGRNEMSANSVVQPLLLIQFLREFVSFDLSLS
jgi:hypothetical protein